MPGPLLDAGLRLSRRCGDAYSTGWCLAFLGRVSKVTGAHEAAVAYLTEALATFRALGHRGGLAFTLEGVAGLNVCTARVGLVNGVTNQVWVVPEKRLVRPDHPCAAESSV